MELIQVKEEEAKEEQETTKEPQPPQPHSTVEGHDGGATKSSSGTQDSSTLPALSAFGGWSAYKKKSKRLKRAFINKAGLHRAANSSSQGSWESATSLLSQHFKKLHHPGHPKNTENNSFGSSSSSMESNERGGGSSGTGRNVDHGPTPLSHSTDHTNRKGYIDSVIRSLLYDEHRGGEHLLRQIVNDVESNINPRDWSLFRCRNRSEGSSGRRSGGASESNGKKWDLDSIKLAHPTAANRVALSIMSNACEGVTFDKFRYDSKAIWITQLLNNSKYHNLMIFVALFHCLLGFVS